MKHTKILFSLSLVFTLISTSCLEQKNHNNSKMKINEDVKTSIIRIEKERVIQLADSFFVFKPETVTKWQSPRSAGGKNDYYSEGTYWWPNPINPDGPYIRKDGVNNPDNFDYHLKAIGNFSWIVGTQTSAYLLTGEKKYAQKAVEHLRAWFLNPDTKMNPHLLYAQAIKGVNTGRGIGIIDAISLIEVSKSVEILEQSPYLSKSETEGIKDWFRSFISWLNTHKYGVDEMNAKNNHGTWWHAQVAAYAKLVDDVDMLEKCTYRYKQIILPNQMATNGSFPLEIERTKPFAYSLFNLDGMATLTWLIDCWDFKLEDGRGMEKGVGFLKPFLLDINSWTYPKDVSYWDEQPGRRPFMFFAALINEDSNWIEIWKNADSDFPSEESKRNIPLKNPVLWIGLNKQVK
jgi:hypothetical protein